MILYSFCRFFTSFVVCCCFVGFLLVTAIRSYCIVIVLAMFCSRILTEVHKLDLLHSLSRFLGFSFTSIGSVPIPD